MAEAGESFEAVGHLYDVQEGTGKAPYRFIVGGVKAQVWKKIKDDDGDEITNPNKKKLEKAAKDKKPVKIKGEYEENSWNDRKFINAVVEKVVTEDLDEDEVAKGDKKSEEAQKNQGRKGGFQQRDESWTAARWALSTAGELLGEGLDLHKDTNVKELEYVAGVFVEASIKLRAKAQALLGESGKGSGAKDGEKAKDKAKDDEES